MLNDKIENDTIERVEAKEGNFEKSELKVKEEEMPRRRKVKVKSYKRRNREILT